MPVPYAFGAATTAIPLSQLDSNFNTPITLGNTAIQLGNTVTTLNNMTLANVTISSGNVTLTNVTVTTANATTVNTTTLIATTANVTTINATDINVAANVTLNGGTANGVAYLNASKVLTTGSALTFDGTYFNAAGLRLRGLDTSNTIYQPTGALNISSQDSFIGIKTLADVPILFSVNSAEQMRLTSTGLGIGTSSPGAKLEVSGGTSAATFRLSTTNNQGGGAAPYNFGELQYWSSDAEAAQVLAYVNAVADTSSTLPGSILAFGTSAPGTGTAKVTERMRLDSSGNLGLGVTPSAWGGSAAVAIELQTFGAAVSSNGAGATTSNFSHGTFFNGTNWIQKAADVTGARYQQTGSSAGSSHQWFVAPNSTAGGIVSFTQAMTLDASGRLLVGGTSSPVSSNIRLLVQSPNATSDGGAQFAYNGGGGGGGAIFSATGSGLVFYGYTGAVGSESYTERARITSGGDLLVGTTSNPSPSTVVVAGGKGYCTRSGRDGSYDGNIFNIQWTGSVAKLWIDNTDLGTISVSSDYHIKKNIQTQLTPALNRVMQLRPVTYEIADYGTLFKSDGIKREGFIAHEVQEVIPSGAEGQKDEENRIQSLRLDAILSVAVKAIQELKAELDTVKAELNTLKGV